MSKKITVSVEQPVTFIDDINGSRTAIRNGRSKISVTCPEISDEPISVHDIRTAPLEISDKSDILSSLLKQYPHMENFPVDDENGMISLKDLYFHILPEVNKEKERKAYEGNVDEFLNGKD